MLAYSSRNIIGDSDVESTFAILENVNAIGCRHSAKVWLRGLDLNQRSGSCRIMSHAAANLLSSKSPDHALAVLVGFPIFALLEATSLRSAKPCARDRVL
jgi:hypothetical protein